MPKFVHFDIYADDVGRASKFYADLFGWEISKWEGGAPEMDYRLVTFGDDSPCPEGGITSRPPDGITGVNYVGVESIEEYLEKVRAGGGRVLQPKIPIPGVGYIVICQDTEGNPLGLFQDDESASY